MRGVVGKSHRCRARASHGCLGLANRPPRAVGAGDETQHRVALLGIEHRSQESAGGIVGVRPHLREGTRDAGGLQARELHRQALPFRRDVEQALAPIVHPLLLHDIALVDELLEHPAQRLFGDFHDVEQVRNLHTGITVDEMQHPVMRTAETQLRQHVVGVAGEVPIGKKQKFNNVPDRLLRARPPFRAGQGPVGCDWNSYVSHIDIFRTDCYPRGGSYETIVPARPLRTDCTRGPHARAWSEQNIPGVAPRRKSIKYKDGITMAEKPYDRLEGVIWYDGKLVPWGEATLHVLSHGLHY